MILTPQRAGFWTHWTAGEWAYRVLIDEN